MLFKQLKYVKLYTLLPLIWVITYFSLRLSLPTYYFYVICTAVILILSGFICCLGYLSLSINNDSFICIFSSLNGASCILVSIQCTIVFIQNFLLSPSYLANFSHPLEVICILNHLFSFSICIFISSIYCDKEHNKKQIFFITLVFISIITSCNIYLLNYYFKQNYLKSNIIVFSLLVSILVILFGLIFYSIIILKKKKFFIENIFSKDFILIFLCTCLFHTIGLPFIHFNTIYDFFKDGLHLIYLIVLFKMLTDVCVISSMQNMNQKLSLHQENNALLNKYIEMISSINKTLKKEYIEMDFMYKQMLKLYPDAFFIISNYTICHANDFALKLLDAPSIDTLVSRNFIDFIAPEFLEEVKEQVQHFLSYNLNNCNIEFELITFQGERVTVEGSFIKTYTGKEMHIMASLRDLSDRKKRSLLEQQVQLEQLRVEFLSNISHELKTPVNIIYSATQLQNVLLSQQNYHKLPHYNNMITQNCMRLLRLLNNLLDITKLDNNYFPFSPTLLNIVTVIENTLDSIIPYASRKNITPLFDTTEEEIYCDLDSELVERILLNLLSNAIKYGKPNGHIYVTLTLDEHNVCIHVKDDGIGIAEEKLAHIFNRFMRVESGLIRSVEGTGIGLSLVKSLVELQKGHISLTSVIDGGTEFIISFPYSKSAVIDPDLVYAHSIDAEKVSLEFSDVFAV